jgi:hypothetical protein
MVAVKEMLGVDAVELWWISSPTPRQIPKPI